MRSKSQATAKGRGCNVELTPRFPFHQLFFNTGGTAMWCPFQDDQSCMAAPYHGTADCNWVLDKDECPEPLERRCDTCMTPKHMHRACCPDCDDYPLGTHSLAVEEASLEVPKWRKQGYLVKVHQTSEYDYEVTVTEPVDDYYDPTKEAHDDAVRMPGLDREW